MSTATPPDVTTGLALVMIMRPSLVGQGRREGKGWEQAVHQQGAIVRRYFTLHQMRQVAELNTISRIEKIRSDAKQNVMQLLHCFQLKISTEIE